MESVTGFGGLRLAVSDVGPLDGPAVLLLHGGAQTKASWDEVAQRLARRGWRAVAPDLRGHGESDWAPDGDYSLHALRHDLMSVVRRVGAPVHVVGASLGGLLGLSLAAKRGDAVASLTLIDVVPRNNRSGQRRIIDFLRSGLAGFDSLEAAADSVAAYHGGRRPPDTSGLVKNLRTDEDGRLRWHWDPDFLLEVRHGWVHRRAHHFSNAARSVTAPTQLLIAERSDVVDDAGAESFRELIPHATISLVPEAEHMISGDEQSRFTRAIHEFLTALTTKQGAIADS
ncbi:alpha/beta fold hydrolase [Aeromicrobium piscarium]|uniref:alpha/beta fold hydrolase n=1 Tax=Aeromicrobium piscarium TaxID=2590901 RepID=UPI00163D7904|nr:alpha/beta fold hydrolase [Aeromicrobium piscarium]